MGHDNDVSERDQSIENEAQKRNKWMTKEILEMIKKGGYKQCLGIEKNTKHIN